MRSSPENNRRDLKRSIFSPVRNRGLRFVAMLTSIVTGGVLLTTGYGGMVNPQEGAVWAIGAMLFPLVLGWSVFLLAVNLVWFRRAAAVNVISLAFSMSAILTFCPMHFFRPSEAEVERMKSPKFKLMTYNMLNLDDYSKGFCSLGDGNPTVEYILSESPDIVVCQEGAAIEPGKKNVTEDQYERIAAAFPYRHVNSRGMGILSRYPVAADLIRHEDQWLYDVNRYEVSLPEEKITIFNLHLQSLGLTAGDKEIYHHLTSGNAEDVGVIRTSLISKLTSALRKRAIQAQVVRSAVDSTRGTVIVCGDFNDIPGCYAQRLIQGDDLRDAYREAGFGPAITYHADRFFFRIDHILYRGGLKPLRAWVGTNESSDHFPLIAWFELAEN
ncbi:MAG: endonuclease/exonuclease/phosphatase family protein [Paramuribaculum sp.]|nr:endonuclease/exonuclease/phosphatase family protein [Paramuribaculum sp.]